METYSEIEVLKNETQSRTMNNRNIPLLIPKGRQNIFGDYKMKTKYSLTYPKRNPLEIYLDISVLAEKQNFTNY
jgi:hypothetical protein